MCYSEIIELVVDIGYPGARKKSKQEVLSFMIGDLNIKPVFLTARKFSW